MQIQVVCTQHQHQCCPSHYHRLYSRFQNICISPHGPHGGHYLLQVSHRQSNTTALSTHTYKSYNAIISYLISHAGSDVLMHQCTYLHCIHRIEAAIAISYRLLLKLMGCEGALSLTTLLVQTSV